MSATAELLGDALLYDYWQNQSINAAITVKRGYDLIRAVDYCGGWKCYCFASIIFFLSKVTDSALDLAPSCPANLCALGRGCFSGLRENRLCSPLATAKGY